MYDFYNTNCIYHMFYLDNGCHFHCYLSLPSHPSTKNDRPPAWRKDVWFGAFSSSAAWLLQRCQAQRNWCRYLAEIPCQVKVDNRKTWRFFSLNGYTPISENWAFLVFHTFFFKATIWWLVTGDIKFKNVHLKHRSGFHHWETHRKLQRCS